MRPSRAQVIGTLAAVGLLAALVVVGRLNAAGRLGRLPHWLWGILQFYRREPQ